MNLRWIISILISLVFHTAVLYGMYYRQPQKPAPAIPMEVTVAPAQPPQPQEPVAQEPPAPPQEADQPEPVIAEDALKFRPVEEDDTEQELPAPEPEPIDQAEPAPQEPEPAKAETPADQKIDQTPSQPEETPRTASEYKQEIEQYRSKIVGDFQEEWQKIPELNTRIPHPSMVAAIDRHFGMTVLAYGFVDHRPAPPFLVFDPATGTFEKTDQFDFSRYSNRVKDRSFDAAARRALEKARREFGLGSFMKIIGLVPIEADRYFAAKQFQAVQSASVPLEQVALTSGHYEPNKAGGFSLIIDSITTINNRTIAIQDNEKTYSQ